MLITVISFTYLYNTKFKARLTYIIKTHFGRMFNKIQGSNKFLDSQSKSQQNVSGQVNNFQCRSFEQTI